MSKKEPKECKEEHTETPTPKRDSIFKGLFEGSIFKVGPTWEEDGKKIVNSPIHYSLDTKEAKKAKKILRELLLKPMPKKFRPKYWLNSSGATREKINNNGYYENILKNYPDYIPTKYEGVIDVDIPRTFPQDPYFQDSKNLKKLKNILMAYSRRNSTVGYCQGFNFIVGRLLKVLNNEEDTFWVFTQVIEDILPTEFYTELAGNMGDCAIVLKLLESEEEKLVEHLKKVNYFIFINNLLYKWFVSLFVENVSEETFLTVWDAMFCEGNIALFRAAIGIFSMLKEEIFKLEEMDELNSFFEEKLPDFIKNDELMKILLEEGSFNMNQINLKRIETYPVAIEEIKKTKSGQKPKEKIECDLDWPFCMNEVNKCSISYVLVIKQMNEFKPDEKFYCENTAEKIKTYNEKLFKKKRLDRRGNQSLLTDREIIINKIDTYSNLLIEREKHTCCCKKKTSKDLKLDGSSDFLYETVNTFSAFEYNEKKFLQSSVIDQSYFDNDMLKSKDVINIIDIISGSEIRHKNSVINLSKSQKNKQQSNKK